MAHGTQTVAEAGLRRRGYRRSRAVAVLSSPGGVVDAGADLQRAGARREAGGQPEASGRSRCEGEPDARGAVGDPEGEPPAARTEDGAEAGDRDRGSPMVVRLRTGAGGRVGLRSGHRRGRVRLRWIEPVTRIRHVGAWLTLSRR